MAYKATEAYVKVSWNKDVEVKETELKAVSDLICPDSTNDEVMNDAKKLIFISLLWTILYRKVLISSATRSIEKTKITQDVAKFWDCEYICL